MNELPFFNCTKHHVIELFSEPPLAEQFNDLLSSHDFRRLLSNYINDKQHNNLDCMYYTIDEFNTKFVKFKKMLNLAYCT